MRTVPAFRCPGPRGLFALLWALLLAGCESLPAPGQTIRVEVVAVPASRTQLPVRDAALLPALDAAIAPEPVAGGRLVLATCASGAAPERRILRTVVTLLPSGTPTPADGALIEVEPDAGRLTPIGGVQSWHHLGRYLGSGAATLDASNGVRHVHPNGSSSLDAHCEHSLRPGALSVRMLRVVSVVDYREAAAMRARHALAGDAELAAGRIVEARCELRVADGSNWRTPHWLVRLPVGISLARGAVIEVTAGASEDSGERGPLSVWQRTLATQATGQRITCH